MQTAALQAFRTLPGHASARTRDPTAPTALPIIVTTMKTWRKRPKKQTGAFQPFDLGANLTEDLAELLVHIPLSHKFPANKGVFSWACTNKLLASVASKKVNFAVDQLQSLYEEWRLLESACIHIPVPEGMLDGEGDDEEVEAYRQLRSEAATKASSACVAYEKLLRELIGGHGALQHVEYVKSCHAMQIRGGNSIYTHGFRVEWSSPLLACMVLEQCMCCAGVGKMCVHRGRSAQDRALRCDGQELYQWPCGVEKRLFYCKPKCLRVQTMEAPAHYREGLSGQRAHYFRNIGQHNPLAPLDSHVYQKMRLAQLVEAMCRMAGFFDLKNSALVGKVAVESLGAYGSHSLRRFVLPNRYCSFEHTLQGCLGLTSREVRWAEVDCERVMSMRLLQQVAIAQARRQKFLQDVDLYIAMNMRSESLESLSASLPSMKPFVGRLIDELDPFNERSCCKSSARCTDQVNAISFHALRHLVDACIFAVKHTGKEEWSILGAEQSSSSEAYEFAHNIWQGSASRVVECTGMKRDEHGQTVSEMLDFPWGINPHSRKSLRGSFPFSSSPLDRRYVLGVLWLFDRLGSREVLLKVNGTRVVNRAREYGFLSWAIEVPGRRVRYQGVVSNICGADSGLLQARHDVMVASMRRLHPGSVEFNESKSPSVPSKTVLYTAQTGDVRALTEVRAYLRNMTREALSSPLTRSLALDFLSIDVKALVSCMQDHHLKLARGEDALIRKVPLDPKDYVLWLRNFDRAICFIEHDACLEADVRQILRSGKPNNPEGQGEWKAGAEWFGPGQRPVGHRNYTVPSVPRGREEDIPASCILPGAAVG